MYTNYHSRVDKKRFVHYLTLRRLEIPEASFIYEYKRFLNLDISCSVDYSEATDFVFNSVLKQVGIRSQEYINAESDSDSNESFTATSSSETDESSVAEEIEEIGENVQNQDEDEQAMIAEQIALIESYRELLSQRIEMLTQQRAQLEQNVQVEEISSDNFSVD